MITMQTTGADALAREMDETVEVAIARAVGALHGFAEEIAETARQRVLVQRDPGRAGPSVLAECIDVAPRADGADVAATAPHAFFVEFGTSRMAAEPFLGPSFRAHLGDIEATI
ncbi:MAG: hypothetical protein MI755_19005 [Sphingomonadales bacterium]|nr:hypothetical protein [Sphingomonadales bacterium]